jgi:hypothetical protein
MTGMRIDCTEIVGNILDIRTGGTYVDPGTMSAHVIRRLDAGDESSSAGCVPRERPERWRRALDQARREVAIMRRSTDNAERLAEDAERMINGRFRPEEARARLVSARALLVRAGRHVRAWGRCIHDTAVCVDAAPHLKSEAEPLMAAAVSDVRNVSKRFMEIAERVGAVILHFQDVTITTPRSDVFAVMQRQYQPKHGPPPGDLRFDHEQHASTPTSPLREGFRRVTRGRAPPRQRTARLHAVPTAAERPVRLRSLS